MKMKMGTNIGLLGCLVFAVACGEKASNSGGGNGGASTHLSQSVVEMKNKMDDLKNLSPGPESSLANALMATDWWTDKSMSLPDERVDYDPGNPTYLSGRDYVSVQLDPKATRENGSSINLFGRMGTVLTTSCALGEVLPASSFVGNYPKNGTHKLNLTAEPRARIEKICGDKMDEDRVITLTVSDVVGSTMYDKKFNVCLGEVSECTNPESTNYYKNTDDVLNIVESHNSGQDPDSPTHVARTTFSLDRVNNTLKAEYVSMPKTPGHLYIHRLYREGSLGMIISSAREADGEQLAYVIKGNLDNKASDVSIEIKNRTHGSGDGCFNRATGILTSPCADPDTDVDVSKVETMVNALVGSGYDAEDYHATINSEITFSGFNDAATEAMSKN